MDFLFCKYRRKGQLPLPSLSKGGSEIFTLWKQNEKDTGLLLNLLKQYKFIFPRTRYAPNFYDLEMSPRPLALFFLEMQIYTFKVI